MIEVNPGGEDFSNANQRKMPLNIIRNVNQRNGGDAGKRFSVLLLPVKTYSQIDEAVDYVNEHDRPLGLYYFGEDKG